MEEALRLKLLANPAMAAMVKKVVWGTRPDASLLPSITLSEIAPGRFYRHDGADNLTQPLVQFDLWADTTWACILLKRLVIAEMEAASVAGGADFGVSFLEAETPGDTEDIEGGGQVNRIIQDWRINVTI